MNKCLLVMATLLAGVIACTSCNDHEDDGSRSFMSVATIMGDVTNGFNCYLSGGGLVVSYDSNLVDTERGYFNFYYNEEDWTISADGKKFIDNAHVIVWSKYDVIHPISKEEAKHLTGKDYGKCPSFLTIDHGYRGYFDLNANFVAVNPVNGEMARAEINLVYDPEEQTRDSLQLQLYYNPCIPDGWSNPHFDYKTVSCDISSLVNLQQWRDSVMIVIKTGDNEKHRTMISKNDFFKPDIKVGD